MTSITIVHNNVDQASSIGKLASWAVETALNEAWHVTVVARDLDPEFRQHVEWRLLYVPPRLHALQWSVARPTVLRAMRGVRSDVLHVYQPQLAAIADTWHVEYLSRVAMETQVSEPTKGVRWRLARLQQTAVAKMEDRYLKDIGERPTALFCSEQMRDHFTRLYGAPHYAEILHNPAFPAPLSRHRQPELSRASLGLATDAFVVGFLGGVDSRKGYEDAIAAVAGLPGGILLMAGPGSAGYGSAQLGHRLVSLGLLSDLTDFWGSCDVLVVPSRFDPFAMVVTEAASHGVPVVVTPAVGASSLVQWHRAGEVAKVDDLTQALQGVRRNPGAYSAGLGRLVSDLSAGHLSAQLLSSWHDAAARNHR